LGGDERLPREAARVGSPLRGNGLEKRRTPPMQKTLRVESSAFTDGSPIPAKYTAKGDDVSPPLSWAGVHATIACFALVMDDPHAAGAPYIHWLAWNLTGTKLPENVSKEGEPATGGVQGTNSAKKV